MKTLDQKELNGYNYSKIEHDINGNPRWVVHFMAVLNDDEKLKPGAYDLALSRAKKIGGKKFHNKQFGGGIVFQSFNVYRLAEMIEESKTSK